MVRAIPLLLLAACQLPDASSKPWKTANPGTPEISAFDLYCDVDAAKWELDVTATAWTGGATTVWTSDAVYIESHQVNSFAAKADGSEDILKLSLRIVNDWRDVKGGSATAFRCAEDPDVLFALRGPAGVVIECLRVGPPPEIWDALEGLPQCE